METVKGVVLYDSLMIISKGCVKMVRGSALYDIVMVICKGV